MNDTSPNFLADGLAAQVKKTPAAVAVVCGDDALTYASLDARSTALALELQRAGHGPGSYIALGFERSTDGIVALWGVVKSGAAYIPVDPAYPDARIAHMAESARWALLLTSAAMAERFRGLTRASAVRVVDSRDVASSPGGELARGGEADPLYAIFTSGSTGQPKAASVFRRGFTNLLRWYIDAMRLDAGCRALVYTSLSFDLTQKNLFAPLLVGGTVVLQPPGPFDLSAIERQIERHGITLINTTPSAFYPLVDAAAPHGFQALATVRSAVLGGEPISIPRLRAWLTAPVTRAFVANTYGPTECTDICAWHRLDRENLDECPFVPMGRAIPGVGLVVVDDAMRSVPPGAIGELCIAGAGVGGGYLNDPARTAERFVPNPFPDRVPGERVYRTGDLVREDAEGVFEFRGRMDHQVKVRGFRIELGEIESALAAHPSVLEAVVTASDAGGEDARLAAWLLPRVAPCPVPEIRADFARRVPAYMLPSSIEWLAEFPMTPNGKVDRISLERRATSARPPAEVPAQTIVAGSAEARVLALWSELLGRPVQDPALNFFDAGGNSIQLAVLHTRLCEMAGRVLPITDLFVHSTARAQAGLIAGAVADPRRQALLDRARRQRAVFAGAGRVERS
ncbi:MAG TPA: non-ribosomal peptide synthetase [Kiritimatiellia bacterium]|nr:non-ribosomal peptide synthetase [Kiritimatiellia bacterium]